MALVTHTHRNLNRLCEEAAMENLARSRRGKGRVSVETLVIPLAMNELADHLSTSRLTATDASRGARIAELRILLPIKGRPSTGNDGICIGHPVAGPELSSRVGVTGTLGRDAPIH